MPHTPANKRFPLFRHAVNRYPYGFDAEQVTGVAPTEEIRARMPKPPQHGNTTTYTNSLKDTSSRSEGMMRCPHNVYNPQLPSKPHCEDMFSDIETLKSHIREDHGFCLKRRTDAASQQENYETIWKELFAGYRGTIPPASGLSPDEMRRMQNLRMFEVIEGFIWNRLGPRRDISREELEEILNSFRSTSSFLFINEATGFGGTTEAPAGPAPVDQRQSAPRPKRHPDDLVPHGQDPETSLNASQSSVNTSETRDKPCNNDQKAALIDTRVSIHQHKVAEIMDKYRELTQSCSGPEYEDDDIREEQALPQHPHVHRTGKESIRTSNSPGDVGEGPGKAMNGPGRNGRSWAASAQGYTHGNIKRRHSRSSSGGNDDEDGSRKRRKQGNVRSKSIDKNAAKFACPYAKHAPDEPFKAASCCYPGFPSVSRVKEHIYRTHAALIQCPRCFESFDDEDGLTTHLRDAARCTQVQTKPDTKTITVEQERKLRSKMKSDAPEELKWRQVYRIIFNLDDTSDTPSPYNDRSSSVFQLFSRYEKHCREALPSLVEKQVNEAILQGRIEIGESLQSTLVEIVLKCHENLFASFRGSESGLPRQPTDPNPLDSPYNYMDLPLVNPDMWEFSLEGTDLGGSSFL